MRIGRSLTITDIDSYITNYISNYELTEAQIAEMIANASGAIGCLSYLLGIDSNKAPYAAFYKWALSIPNNAWTEITWTSPLIDNLDIWNADTPTKLNLLYSGIYDIGFYIQWADNATGRRGIQIEADTIGDLMPRLSSIHPAIQYSSNLDMLGGIVGIKGSSPFSIKLFQNSGGSLATGEIHLLIGRRAFLPYFW